MKTRVLWAGFVCSVTAAVLWWFRGEMAVGFSTTEQNEAHQSNSNVQHQGSQPVPAERLSLDSRPPTSERALSVHQGDQLGSGQNHASNTKEQDNPYAQEAMKSQFMQIADQYEATIQYPVSSQPIVDQNDLQRYLPPDSADTELPFPLPDYDSPVKLRLQLERYQYYFGESIPVGLAIEGAKERAQVNAVIQLKGLGGRVIKQQTLMMDDESDLLYSVISPGPDETWPAEMQVIALVELDDQQLSISAPLKYQSPSATLTSVGYSQVKGEWLEIPLTFSVNQSGYFFVSSNLYSAKTGLPLIHLEAEGPLSGGVANMTLNAHYAALKAKGDEGDYLLKDIQVVKAAGDQEVSDVAGRSAQRAFPVVGYAFSTYAERAYVDPDAQEKLAFLRRLGTIGAN